MTTPQFSENCVDVAAGDHKRKGDTIVSPSDFQSEDDQSSDNNAICGHSLSRARTHTRTRKLFVLIACEESQAECAAFRELGHEAYSCDVQISTGGEGHRASVV